jgi:hypothetical protein
MNLNAPRYQRRYKEADEDSEYITPSTFKHPKIIPDKSMKQISLHDPDNKNKFMRHILPTVAAFGLGSIASKALNFNKRPVNTFSPHTQVCDLQRPQLTLEPPSWTFGDGKQWILPEWREYLENYQPTEEDRNNDLDEFLILNWLNN